MDQNVLKMVNKILISGNREDLDDLLEGLNENTQKEILINLLTSSSFVMQDSMLTRVKTRPLLYHLISNAEKRGKSEGKEVYVTYADQRKLGKISSTYGVEVGDTAIKAFIDSLHKGLNNIKNSDYDIIRMGGDEFCIVAIGETKNVVDQYLKEAKTIANNYSLERDGNKINEKVDFTYGITKLDYSGGRTLRQIIDEAKREEYYQAKLSEAEEIAEAKKKVLIDLDKETEKIKAIKSYIELSKDVRKKDEETDYQIIAKKTDMITSKRNKRSSIDNEFVVKLSKIADTKGIKKEVLIEELYDYDLDFLKNNFIAFGEDFIREGKENFIKKNSLDSLMNIIDIMPSTKMKYVEVDNLKLVNSARSHAEGDNYISDFMDIVDSSMKDAKDPTKESYAVRVSGNALLLIYNEDNENIIQSINEKAREYKNPNINISMDVYTEDVSPESYNVDDIKQDYQIASENVKEQKIIKNRNKQKIIYDNTGYEIFYQREIFTMDEVESVVDVRASEVGIDDSYLNELVSTYGNKAYSVIEEEFSDDLSQEIIDLFEDKITVLLLKGEIKNELDEPRVVEDENEDDSEL